MGMFDQYRDDAKPGGNMFEQYKDPEEGDLSRGFKQGLQGMKGAAGGIISLLGKGVGSDGVRQFGLEMFNNAEQRAQELSRPTDSLENAGGVGDVVDFLQNQAGQFLPSLALMAVTGGLGGAAGKAIGQTIGTAAAKTGARIGATSGIAAASGVPTVGGIYPEALAEGVENPELRALGGGALSAALDTIPIIRALRMSGVMGKTAREAVPESLLGKAGMAAREIGKQSGIEGATEGAQTLIERGAAGKALDSNEAIWDVINSVVGGGGIGGAMGIPGAAMRIRQRPEQPLDVGPDQPVNLAAGDALRAQESRLADLRERLDPNAGPISRALFDDMGLVNEFQQQAAATAALPAPGQPLSKIVPGQPQDDQGAAEAQANADRVQAARAAEEARQASLRDLEARIAAERASVVADREAAFAQAERDQAAQRMTAEQRMTADADAQFARDEALSRPAIPPNNAIAEAFARRQAQSAAAPVATAQSVAQPAPKQAPMSAGVALPEVARDGTAESLFGRPVNVLTLDELVLAQRVGQPQARRIAEAELNRREKDFPQEARPSTLIERQTKQTRELQDTDSLLPAIAKLGGLDRDQAIGTWGLDPQDFRRQTYAGMPVLRKKGGVSLDEMAARLVERGYLQARDLQEFESLFSDEASGARRHFNPRGADVAAAQQMAEQADFAQQEAEFDANQIADVNAELASLPAEASLPGVPPAPVAPTATPAVPANAPALLKGQARLMAASATRQGTPSEVVPHPVEPGKFAVVPKAQPQSAAPAVQAPAPSVPADIAPAATPAPDIASDIPSTPNIAADIAPPATTPDRNAGSTLSPVLSPSGTADVPAPDAVAPRIADKGRAAQRRANEARARAEEDAPRTRRPRLSTAEPTTPKGQQTRQWLADRPDVTIVDRQDELPTGGTPIKSGTRIDGMYDPATGKVYVVAENVPNEARARWVAAHEGGHKGFAALDKATNGEATKRLTMLRNNRTVREIAEKIGGERDTDGTVNLEEAIAEVIAANEAGNFDAIARRYGVSAEQLSMTRNVVQRFMDWLRTWFQQRGATDADVKQLMRDIIAESRQGGEGGARLSTAPGTIDVDGKQRPTTNSNGRPIAPDDASIRNFWRWFGDSKVVDEQGRPIISVHYTSADFTAFDSRRQEDARLNESGYTTNFGRFYTFPDSGFFFFAGEAPSPVGNRTRNVTAYLSIKDPLDLTRNISAKDIGKIIDFIQARENSPATPGHWGFTVRGDALGGFRNARKIGATPAQLWAFLNKNSGGLRGELWDDLLRALGKDGVIFDGNSSGTAMLEEQRGEGDGMVYRVAVAIRPEQIKSATGNAGTFDGTNPDIRFSTVSDAVDYLRAPKTTRGMADAVLGLFKTHGTFNVLNKTIGTQFHKATKDPLFKRVFDAIQDFLSDVTHYAMEAETQAPDVLLPMKRFGDIGKAIKAMGGQYRKDIEAIAKPLFANIEGESGVQQRVFTPAELKADYGLTDKQVEMYQQYRAAIDTSLDRLGQTLLMRMGRTLGMDVDSFKNTSMEETADELRSALNLRIQAAEEKVAAMKENFANEQAKLRGARDEQTLQVDERGRMTQQKRKDRSVEQAQKAVEDAEAAVKGLQKSLGELNTVATNIKKLQDSGYTPAMRFGQYAVTAYEGDQKQPAFFGLYESRMAANIQAAKLRRNNPAWDVQQGQIDPKAHELFQKVPPDLAELFGKFMGLEENDAFKQYVALAASSRSALKRQLERQGTAGFSEDALRVLAAFLTSNARAASSNIHGGEINDALVATRDSKRGDVMKEARELVDYVQNPKEESSFVRSLMFTQFLGGSIAAGVVNMTQPVLVTAPHLSKYVGAGDLARIMQSALKIATTGKGASPTLKRAMDRAAEEGLTDPHEIYHLMAEASGGSFGRSLPARAFNKAWGSFFSVSEAWNRRVAFSAAFQTAEQMTPEALRKAGYSNAYDFAKNAVNETQFIYNKGNRPNWARGPIGSTVFTFRQFSVSYIEFLSRLPWKQKAIALTMLTLAAGLEGFPFMEDAQDIIDTVFQRAGFATNSKAWVNRLAAEWMGDGLADFAMHGFSALPGVPLDVSARLGASNLIPGTRIFNPSAKDKTKEVLEVFGAPGSFAMSAIKAGSGEGYVDVLPKALKDFYKAIEMATTGEARDARGNKVANADAVDAFVKAIGFQPAQIAEKGRTAYMVQRDIDIQKRVESEIAGKWARGIADNDPEDVAEARERLQQWNADNPELPIRIGLAQIRQRVNEMQRTREERLIRRAPPEVRQRIAAELQ